MNNCKKHVTIKKNILLASILLLFFGGGLRACSIYEKFKSTEDAKIPMKQLMEDNKENVIDSIFKQGTLVSNYAVENIAYKLESKLLEKYSKDEIYQSLIKESFNSEMLEVFDNVFDLKNIEHSILYTVATKDSVIFNKSNVDYDKFNYFETNGKKSLSWDEFYLNLDNPEITKQAFYDLVTKKTDIAVLRFDGNYEYDGYYTMDDVILDYLENGTKNLDKYFVVTSAVITEEGDMFGERETDYMQMNENLNRLYIFRAISVNVIFDKYTSVIDNIKKEYEINIQMLDNRNMYEFSHTLVTLVIILTVIILLMILLKDVINEENIIKSENDSISTSKKE